MAQYIADRRDQDFVLHEMLEAAKLSETRKYPEFSRKTIDMTLSAARELALKEILPVQQSGDREEARLENGSVKVPPSYHKPYRKYCEGEWIAMCDDPEYGGQGMPHILATACGEMFGGSNCAFIMYPFLTHGAANIIATVGDEKQKNLYIKKMFSGEWGGTMCLTEAEAGSDVGALQTVATGPNPDGTYDISGNKIFISGGDSDLVSNIIHPVLARIEGAPAGTPGISLFIVPKIWVNDDGSAGEDNDVVVTGIEHKLGIRGNATCSMSFGSNGRCRGWLLGEKNKGMRAMFLMMNEARQGAAMQGMAYASASYLNALNYARERKQGPDLLKATLERNITPVPIIQHPDVRRQLMLMKTYVEGMRGLVYFLGWCFDMVNISEDQPEKEKWQGLIDLLTPIAKAYCTEKGFDVTSMGIQIFGGYGFIEEYPQAQIMRDCRIVSLYEGTTGIQGMDLLGRKLGMKKGRPVMDLMAEIAKTVKAARETGLDKMAESLQKVLNLFGEASMIIGTAAMSEKVMNAFASATLFTEAAGDVLLAWIHVWRAVVARSKMEKASARDKAFYEGQITGARFFVEHVLPVVIGKIESVKALSSAAIDMPEEAFGS